MTHVLCRICRGEGCATCGHTGLRKPIDLARALRGPKSSVKAMSVGGIAAFRASINAFAKSTKWRPKL